ncbi:serine/threonine protein kinase [Micromonospora sp. NPDC126480]|uniref:serine/threonine protein kinase n=1 Tax=Micromonospora sp. NPDC126480 TaxID=3155312 RepID=UPI003323D937
MLISTDPAAAFAVFAEQGSGCLAYGVESGGRRWFVKTAGTPQSRASLARAAAVHAAIRHDVIVRPELIFDGTDGPTLVYPWCDGTLLHHATVNGSDRSGLARFQRLPLAEVYAALDAILDAHLAVAAAGYVTVDLYDGCFLYDFDAHRMRLIDLDEYRPGPFILDSEQLPGSRRYMAPEESVRGSVIDQRTSVYVLGRTVHHLLDSPDAWRGTAAQRRVVERATRQEAARRYGSVAALVRAWRATRSGGGRRSAERP